MPKVLPFPDVPPNPVKMAVAPELTLLLSGYDYLIVSLLLLFGTIILVMLLVFSLFWVLQIDCYYLSKVLILLLML